jgi:LEA14-like dessication related protein
MKKLNLFILLVLIALIGYGGAYIYSLSEIEVRSVNINRLTGISLSGFSLNGDINLYNGGIVPVKVSHINYDITLEQNGRELTTGYIEGRKIKPKQTAKFPMSNTINWVPSASVALGLITPGQTFAKVDGVVHVADLKFIEFKVPFSKRVDLEPYIKQFVVTKVRNIVNTLSSTARSGFEAVSDSVNKITASVVDTVGKWFN